MRRLRRGGFEWPAILVGAFGQPRSWLGWYPPSLRAPGDAWERLPLELRRARAMLAWTVVMLFLVLIPNMLTVISFDVSNNDRRNPYPLSVRDAVTDGALTLFLFPAAAAFLLIRRWELFSRSRLADRDLRGHALVMWTGQRSFWRRPEIAVLLLPEGSASGRNPSLEPTTISGLLSAVGAIANTLPAPVRTVGAQARASARQLADAITSLDKQIAGLARALDHEEARRLVDKLAALGPDGGPADENREVREILQKQLDTVRGLEARIGDAKARRAERFELLKALWLQAVELRAATGDADRTNRTTGRIRTLCAEIAQQLGPSPVTRAFADEATEAIRENPTIEK
ncbi:MAG: hypothetical protein JJE39_08980 [Vicinamibacteria bacterium]|nr:hypothetical protein [Vicinamibacteria bacterium]